MVPVTDQTWKRLFLIELMKHGVLASAAGTVGKRPSEVRAEMAKDEEFRLLVNDSVEIANGQLEVRARTRAMNESDSLMVRLLEANIPDKFRRDAPPTTVTFVKTYMEFNPDMWDGPDYENIQGTNTDGAAIEGDQEEVEGEVIDVEPTPVPDHAEMEAETI